MFKLIVEMGIQVFNRFLVAGRLIFLHGGLFLVQEGLLFVSENTMVPTDGTR